MSDRHTFEWWLSEYVDTPKLEAWVDGPLAQSWGRTAATRVYHIATRGCDVQLANALSALYPRDSEEKRLLDAMLLAVPR